MIYLTQDIKERATSRITSACLFETTRKLKLSTNCRQVVGGAGLRRKSSMFLLAMLRLRHIRYLSGHDKNGAISEYGTTKKLGVINI